MAWYLCVDIYLTKMLQKNLYHILCIWLAPYLSRIKHISCICHYPYISLSRIKQNTYIFGISVQSHAFIIYLVSGMPVPSYTCVIYLVSEIPDTFQACFIYPYRVCLSHVMPVSYIRPVSEMTALSHSCIINPVSGMSVPFYAYIIYQAWSISGMYHVSCIWHVCPYYASITYPVSGLPAKSHACNIY